MSKPRPVIRESFAGEWERQGRRWPEDGFTYSIIEYTRQILEAMEDQGVTQAELARRADLKPSYVSRVLNSPENITLRTAFRLCHALDLKLGFDIKPYPDPLYQQPESPRPRTRPKPASKAASKPARKQATV